MTKKAIQKALEEIKPIQSKIFSIQRNLFEDLGKSIQKSLKSFQKDVENEDVFILIFYKQEANKSWNFVINISGKNIDNQSIKEKYPGSKHLEKILKECSSTTKNLEDIKFLPSNVSIKIEPDNLTISFGNF